MIDIRNMNSADELYTQEEIRKLLKISHQKDGQLFNSAKDFLHHLDRL